MLSLFPTRAGVAAILVGLLGVACHASPLPKPPPKVATVLGADKAPLVVDWPAGHRSDLAATTADGIAVVHVEQSKLTLLRDCRLSGSYGFVGFTTKEQVIRLEDAADVALSLPLRGAGIAGDLGGELGASMALDVALVTVGRRRTVRTSALRGMLKGDDCKQATHFVRGFDVGAFVLATSEKNNVHTVASLFGAKGSYARKGGKDLRETDGKLDACQQANPDDKTPPAHCSAALRLDLKAIDEDENVETASCTDGLVRAGGKCQPAKLVKAAFECNPKNEDECRAQCDAGDGASCGHLANATRRAADFKTALATAQRGCELASERSCVVLGELHQYGNGIAVDMKKAAELFEKACVAGEALGCFHEATLYDRRPGLPVDWKKATALYERACRGGVADGCNNLGALALAGHGGPPEPERARAVYEDACKNGSATACGNLADLLAGGIGGPKDTTRAGELWGAACATSGAHCVRLGDALSGAGPLAKDPLKSVDAYQRGIKLLSAHCQLGIGDRCDDLGWLFHDGHAIPRDDEQAFTYVKKGCTLGSPGACNHVGVFLEHGWGVPQNREEAKKTFAQACDAGNLHACVSRALADANAAGRKDLFARACSGGVAVGCYHQGRLERVGLQDGKATTLLEQACNDGHAPACSYLGRWKGRPTPNDASTALLEKGCTKGDLPGCATLAEVLSNKAGQSERAEAFARRACEGGVAQGCGLLAELAAAGKTRQITSADGSGLLQKACDGHDLSSCVALGQRIVASEPGRAAGLFQRACDLASATPPKLAQVLESHASNRESAPLAEAVAFRSQEIGKIGGLGSLGGTGSTSPNSSESSNLANAAARIRLPNMKALDLEDAGAEPDERHLGCAALGEMHENGNGFPKSVADAQPFYAAACTFDDGRGCSKLAAIEAKQPKADKLRVASLFDRACQFGEAASCVESAKRAVAEKKYDLAVQFYESACSHDDKRCPATEKAIASLGHWTSKPVKVASETVSDPVNGDVKIEKVQTDDAFPDADRVLTVLRARLKTCYKGELLRNPGAHGKIVLAVKVAPSGEVTAVGLNSDTTDSTFLSACTAATVKTAKFAPGKGGTFAVPMLFAPR